MQEQISYIEQTENKLGIYTYLLLKGLLVSLEKSVRFQFLTWGGENERLLMEEQKTAGVVFLQVLLLAVKKVPRSRTFCRLGQ